MREIGHFIGGKEVKGASGRFGDVFNPNTGEVQAKVALAAKSEVEKAIANAEAAFPGWAATNPQRRARVMFKFLELIQSEYRRSGATAVLRARQDLRRRQGRHPARARSGRVRLRHPESDEGRVFRGRRPRYRSLFDPPTARRRRRHHAVQFSGHDPAVEMRAGDRLRQRLHPQTVGARSVGADADRRTVRQGGTARGRAQRRQRRQGGGRYAADRRAGKSHRLSSARRRSPNIFMRPAPRTANACNASAAPRTT